MRSRKVIPIVKSSTTTQKPGGMTKSSPSSFSNPAEDKKTAMAYIKKIQDFLSKEENVKKASRVIESWLHKPGTKLK